MKPPFKGIGAIDPGIAKAVRILWENGVETYESCQGGSGHRKDGSGHCFPEPTVRFHGDINAGLHAVHVARTYGLKVVALRRFWRVINGELDGPSWEITFMV